MLKFLVKRIRWIIVAVGVLFFFLTQIPWFKQSNIYQHAEGLLIDRRYDLRGTKAAQPDIKLLGVENSTISLDQLWPEEIEASPILQLMQKPVWDRRIYAAVLEKLMGAGAKVVVFDFVFAGETEGDGVFAEALQKYKDRVVIGAKVEAEEVNGEISGRLTPPNKRLLLPGTEGIIGIVLLQPDPDDVTRRGLYHTSIERETLKHPKLAPQTTAILRRLIADGKAPDNLIHMSALTVKKFAGHVATPPSDRSNFINFRGPPGTYGVLPMEKLFVEKLWNAPPFSSGTIFSNKIVIVGPIAEIYHDVHATPFGEMAGPEIQAQMMATLLEKESLKEPSPAFNIVFALIMTGLSLVICLWIQNALLKVLLLIIATVIFLVASQVAFAHFSMVINMTSPLFCLIATGAYGATFQFALEQFERRRTRNALDRYVSKNVAKTILEDRSSFMEKLSGRKQFVTILFSDIRGFTTMTENSDPEQLVSQLKEYFAEMVGVIEDKNSGTLQKFIGDAIMAAWGDTHSEGFPEDARRAVTAALQMRNTLNDLNERWVKQRDRQKYQIGIGVNHGEVIYGNIGSEQRMELTVLGDGVNLAARLESSTKQFHTDILIGEGAEALTREHFVYRNVGAIAFKGKTKPIEVFTLLSDRSQPAPPWLEKYHEAIRLYRGKQFGAAEELFKTVVNELGGHDFLCEMYLQHCEACHQTPPPANWNGAFTLTEK